MKAKSRLVLGLALLIIASISQVSSQGQFFKRQTPKKILNRNHYNWMTVEESNLQYSGPTPLSQELPIDHFNGSKFNDVKIENTTFLLRYIIDEQYNLDKQGPILFYAGGAGSLEAQWEHIGFLTTNLTQKLNATVVVAEHRYYGKSIPFNNESQAFENQNLKYLSVEQAMKDYVMLLQRIKELNGYDNNTCCPNGKTPVFVFGNTYSGMLATWLRMKYPATFNGAIASGAPILQFKGVADPNQLSKIANDVVKKQFGPQCSSWMDNGFYDLIQAQMVESTYQNISKIFNICSCCNITKPDDVQSLIDYVEDALLKMTKHNLPYETNDTRQGSLPAWPVNASCNKAQWFADPYEDTLFNFKDIKKLAAMISVSQGDKCINLTGPITREDHRPWGVQKCSEMAMPIGNDPAQSSYTWTNWDEDAFTQYCQQTYGLTPKYDWALSFFGGKNARRDFRAHTNIVWVNGEYDPWHGGSVTSNITSGTTSIFVKQATSNYDLRLPHINDTVQIIEARNIELMHLQKWIAEWKMKGK